MGDDGACANYRTRTDVHAAHNLCAVANPYVIANDDVCVVVSLRIHRHVGTTVPMHVCAHVNPVGDHTVLPDDNFSALGSRDHPAVDVAIAPEIDVLWMQQFRLSTDMTPPAAFTVEYRYRETHRPPALRAR